MPLSSPRTPPTPSAIWYVDLPGPAGAPANGAQGSPEVTAQNTHEVTAQGTDEATMAADSRRDDDTPVRRAAVEFGQGIRVGDRRYDSVFQPLLLPKHIAYDGLDNYMERLHKTQVAWNDVDCMRPGPDGRMVRSPMSAQSYISMISTLGFGRMPLPELHEGPAPDPSRRCAEYGLGFEVVEFEMVDDNEMGLKLVSENILLPSLFRDRAVYNISDGQWLIARIKGEDALAVCLRMAQIEGWEESAVRDLLSRESVSQNLPDGPRETQIEACLAQLGPGAELLNLGGMTHADAMAKMKDMLWQRGCGILVTQGHARILNKIGRLGNGSYAFEVRDPDTCSRRNIRDHLEFWRDQSTSPQVTPVPADWIHPPSDVFIVPPKRIQPAELEFLA